MRLVPLLLASCAALAQGAFEVASVKPSPPGAAERSLTRQPGAKLSASNATVKMLIFLAYQLMPFQVTGGPDWVGSEGFDIQAKAENPKATPEQFREMLQRLLVERFHLQYHLATKELPIYTLVVAKSGSKLVEAKAEGLDVGMRNEGRGRLVGVKATMPMLAGSLTRVLQRKVVDETGLKGGYSFTLQFAPDENATDMPSIFTALEEQLGLALKGGRGPVEVFVIDGAERPLAN